MSQKKFSLQLFKKLENNGSFAFCPTSIYNTLLMVYLGSSGDTSKEMKKLLSYYDKKEFKKEFKKISAFDNNGSLSQHNSIYVEASMELKEQFTKLVKGFGVIVMNLNFSKNAEKERVRINSDVLKNTKDQVSNLLPPGSISGSTKVVLVNAIYFKGKWKNSFDPKSSWYNRFTTIDEENLRVKMMTIRDEEHMYGEDKYKKWVTLPYQDEDFVMHIIIPKADDFFTEMDNPESKFSLNKTEKTELTELSIPKFKLEKPLELKEILSNLGMKKAFTEDADFSIMSSANLSIDEVHHKTVIYVDEKGTVAAAATAAVMYESNFILKKKVLSKGERILYVINHLFLS